MNKVCVYAIAKDEAPNVKEWVESMKPADHIIVLDTGSTDNTVELLTSLGVEVHEKHYDHFRFDTARNDCLDLIPEEYNIRVSIDLDERFEKDDWADVLRNSWDEENPRVVYKYVWNHNTDGTEGLVFIINKIHGLDPDLRWVGAVHEHLTFMSTGKREFSKFIDCTETITVHHYHNLDKDRNFYKELAWERLQEMEDDPQAWILYGNEQKVKGDPAEAVKAYNHVLENFMDKCDMAELASCYYSLGDCYNKLHDGFKSMSAFAAGIALNKYYRDNYFGLGVLLIANEMYDMAIGVLLEGLKTSQRAYSWTEDPFTWTFSLYDALGVAYHETGNHLAALSCAAKALSYDSTNEELIAKYNAYLNAI